MTNEPYKEEVKFEANKEDCTIKMIETIPMKNPKGKIVGAREMVTEAKTTKSEMSEAFSGMKQAMKNLNNRLEDVEKKVNMLPKKPFKTSEMVRIEKSLNAISAIREHDKLDAQAKSILEQMDSQKEIMKARAKSLNIDWTE